MFDALWQEWKCCTFDGMKLPGTQLIELFASLLFDLSRVWGFTNSDSMTDFFRIIVHLYINFVIL